MECPDCGTGMPDIAKFCMECGKRLPVAEATRPCPRCGTPVAANARFCGECGLDQRRVAPAPASEGDAERLPVIHPADYVRGGAPFADSPAPVASRNGDAPPEVEKSTIVVRFEGRQFENLKHRSDATEAANRVIEEEMRIARANGWEPATPIDFATLLQMRAIKSLKHTGRFGRTSYTLRSVSIPVHRRRRSPV